MPRGRQKKKKPWGATLILKTLFHDTLYADMSWKQFVEFWKQLPPKATEAVKPEHPLHIAKCCATCKHFLPISAAKYHHGFCTLGFKNELRSGIRIKYDSVHSIIGSVTDVLQHMRETYPEVHEFNSCIGYVKVVQKKRLKGVLRVIKSVQDKLIFDKDLEI